MTDGNTERQPLFREPAIGPEALKAFAHPLRMAMYNYLSEHGSATASQLGRHLGESSGQTSYHLRQLERHGFVEDDPAHPRGRDRWWRAVGFSIDGREMLTDPGTSLAARALVQGVVAERAQVLNRWLSTPEDDPAWLAASLMDRSTADLTAAELHDLVLEMQTVMSTHLDRAKALREAGDTAGRRRIRVYLDALPLPLDDEQPAGAR
ncbi:helix-turn-helix domain-containing protein [Cellulomonas sp. McL0617]|uniref:helix-turn-helix domain-containing protein n=1 Tax=Cellulomonas sp. McL0617 TaxID=3415675 RepID=UPI003CF12468